MTILVSLLAALALAVGGYGLLLDWRRAPIATADPQGMPPPPFTLAEVTRLERLHEVVPAAAQLGFSSHRRGRLAIELTDLSAAGLPDTAGVAVIAVDTEAQLDWLPLAAFQQSGGTARAVIEAPAMPLRLVFAARPTAALRSWWTQIQCTVQDSGTTAVRLDAKAQTVTVDVLFRGEPGPASRVPFSLRRVGNDDWHYVADNGAVDIVSTADGRLLLTVGAGDYVLASVLDTREETFALRVPTTGPVRAEFTR